MANSILCGACSTLNPLGSQSCKSCHQPLFYQCSRCDGTVPTHREYCPACGLRHNRTGVASLVTRLTNRLKSVLLGSSK